MHGQRINGAVEPLERRVPGCWTSGGYLHRSIAQRIAIMQMPIEPHSGFEAMDDADYVSGYANAGFHSLVLRKVVWIEQARDHRIDFEVVFRPDLGQRK